MHQREAFCGGNGGFNYSDVYYFHILRNLQSVFLFRPQGYKAFTTMC